MKTRKPKHDSQRYIIMQHNVRNFSISSLHWTAIFHFFAAQGKPFSLEIRVPDKGDEGKSDIDQPEFFIFVN